MNKLDLSYNNLTELTKSDLKALCHLNNIEHKEITELYLGHNYLKNIDFIKPFVKLRKLILSSNKITDISNIKYLKNLELLGIGNLKLNNEKDMVDVLKNMSKLEYLYCYKTFKTYTIEQLKKELPNITLYN